VTTLAATTVNHTLGMVLHCLAIEPGTGTHEGEFSPPECPNQSRAFSGLSGFGMERGFVQASSRA